MDDEQNDKRKHVLYCLFQDEQDVESTIDFTKN